MFRLLLKNLVPCPTAGIRLSQVCSAYCDHLHLRRLFLLSYSVRAKCCNFGFFLFIIIFFFEALVELPETSVMAAILLLSSSHRYHKPFIFIEDEREFVTRFLVCFCALPRLFSHGSYTRRKIFTNRGSGTLKSAAVPNYFAFISKVQKFQYGRSSLCILSLWTGSILRIFLKCSFS